MALSGGFRLKIITPAGLVLDKETDSVKLPSSEGEIGVLPMHTKYSGLLGEGVVEFTTETGVERVTISGGLTQFSQNTLTILADRVEPRS